jgi:hypothetical protein
MPRHAARLFPAVVVVLALGAPAPANAATCADYPNQAAAQRAHDTRDADGDGIYCESLPCPCSTANGGSGEGGRQPESCSGADSSGCVRPRAVQLGSGARDAPARQQTLRATIETSTCPPCPAAPQRPRYLMSEPGMGSRRVRLVR